MHVDLLVIGFGKAGKTLAGALGKQGRSVAMVEQSDQMYGGTCINIGCVPTKALVHDAATRRDSDDPAAFYEAAITRKTQLTDLLRGKNFDMLDTVDAITVITGRARFTGPTEVEVTGGADSLTITAEHVVVNTGAVPVMPDVPGLVDSRFLRTSTSLIATRELPKHLVVIGGGPIGLELASVYRGFGSEVTVLQRDRFFAREDDDVAAAATTVLREGGITLVEHADVNKVVDADSAVTVHFTADDAAQSVAGDAVLVASGRRPATDDLGLDVAGIDVDDRGGIVVDGHLRTSNDKVFAVGDVNGGPQFTYISYDDHRIVLDALTGEGRRTTADRVATPNTTFITPPLSRVGLTEREAREAGHDVVVKQKDIAAIAAMPRARIMEETRGLVKVVVDGESDRVLGATLFCVDSQELINFVALAMRAGTTAAELRDGIWTHPSSTEAFNEVLK